MGRHPPGVSPSPLLLALAALSSLAAAACTACPPLTTLTGPSHSLSLAAAGCACSFSFTYATGPALGTATLSFPRAFGDVSVFAAAPPASPLAAFTAEHVGGTVYSETGLLVVAFASPAASVPLDARIEINVTSINAPPVLTVDPSARIEVGVAEYLRVPANSSTPLPVTVSDPDNFGDLLVSLSLTSASLIAPDPAPATVAFLAGEPGVPGRTLTFTGPRDAVQDVVAAARIERLSLGPALIDDLVVSVSDLGNSGLGSGPLISTFTSSVAAYPSGVLYLSPPAQLSSGFEFVFVPPLTTAEYHIRDAHEIVFSLLEIEMGSSPDAPCRDFLRVYDGGGPGVGRLLSTELAPTGEICGENSIFLPTYRSQTGTFVVELETDDSEAVGMRFIASLSPTPGEFAVWTRDSPGATLQAAAGQLLPLGEILVTGRPGNGAVTVRATTTHSAVVLRFSESFGDLVDSTAAPGTVVLRSSDLLRLALALVELQFVGSLDDTVVVTASTADGQEAASLSMPIVVSALAINAPLQQLATNAFRPFPLPVSVVSSVGGLELTATISTTLGAVSVDDRAMSWLMVGYNSSLVIPPTTDLSAALAPLTFRSSDGGTASITIAVSSPASGATASTTLAVFVDPECSGDHIVYERSGFITDGSPGAYSADLQCTWSLIGGGLQLAFPVFDLGLLSLFELLDASDGSPVYVYPPRDPRGTFEAPEGFVVQITAAGFRGGGFVGVFEPLASNQAPLVLAPTQTLRAVRGTVLRLGGLYVTDTDFEAGPVRVSLEAAGEAVVDFSAASFAELDARLTSIDFAVGTEMRTLPLELQAEDSQGARSEAAFHIDVLPCDGLREARIDRSDDAGAAVVIEDGSGVDDYTPGLSCQWRATGAPSPATLRFEFLDMDCDGDAVSVYDGATLAGQLLGTFCTAAQVEERGRLVSLSGSFLVVATSDSVFEDDGFALEYGALAPRERLELGAPDASLDPLRTEATLVALTDASFVVVGGRNGVRSVLTPMRFELASGAWSALSSSGGATPTSRHRASGIGVAVDLFLLHGGVGASGELLGDTWSGRVQDGLVIWTLVADDGPESAATSLHNVGAGTTVLIDAAGAEVFEFVGDHWRPVATVPSSSLVPGTAAADGGSHIYALDEGAVAWALDTAVFEWHRVGESPIGGASIVGAMLGGEFAVFGEDGATHALDPATETWRSLSAPGSSARVPSGAVPGTLFERPAALLFGGGQMEAFVLSVGVTGALRPALAPSTGGTVVTVSGERLAAECGAEAACEFAGRLRAPATILDEQTAICTTPPVGGTASAAMRFVCGTVGSLRVEEDLVVFDGPAVVAVEPAEPLPGDLLLVSLNVSAAVLAAVADPLCELGDSVVVGELDGVLLRCRLGADAASGPLSLRVSLDGQQFAGPSWSLQVASPPSSGSSSSSRVVVIVVPVVAAAAVVVAIVIGRVMRHRVGPSYGLPAWEIAYDSIELLETIGAGGFGSVYRGQFRGGEVAVKMALDGNVDADTIEAFRKESALMADLRHPNIVLFMGACTEPPNIAIVLEFMARGTLYDLLANESVLMRDADKRRFALDIAKGMAYLHAADPPIVHRDLKSLNVLADAAWTLKVSDFGMTGSVGPAPAGGSVYWQAPEVLRGDEAGMSSDVYAYGVTLWEISLRQVPYGFTSPVVVATRVAGGPIGPGKLYRPDLEADPVGQESGRMAFETTIRACWAEDPDTRPSFEDVKRQLQAETVVDELDSVSDAPPSTLASATSPRAVTAVVFWVSNFGRLWSQYPASAANAISGFLDRVAELAGTSGLTARVMNERRCVAVADTNAKAVAFALEAGALQTSPVAFGAGLARGQTEPDGALDARFAGPAVERAIELARAADLNQILMTSEVAHAATGARQVATGVFALGAGGAQQSPPQDGDDQGPAWMIARAELEIGQLIGAGSFGTVFKATWRGTPVVAKQLHRKKLAAREALDLHTESEIASKLRHPNVCLVLGVCKDADADMVFVVSEYMSKGSVFEAIVMARKPVGDGIKVKVAKGLALGLRYLHEQSPPIVHRSLTARNVLLGDGWTAKISDFGLARVKDTAATMTKIGSTAYSAPELLRGERYDEKADVYAYAMVVWEMAAQEVAWGSKRRAIGVLAQQVLQGARPPLRPEWQLAAVAERCWAGEVERRPAMADVVGLLDAM